MGCGEWRRGWLVGAGLPTGELAGMSAPGMSGKGPLASGVSWENSSHAQAHSVSDWARRSRVFSFTRSGNCPSR